MLHVFYGTDTVAVRREAQNFIDVTSGGTASVLRIDSDAYEAGIVRDRVQGRALFGGTEVIVLDTLKGCEGAFEEVLEVLPLLRDSEDTFVIIENTLTALEKRACGTYAKRCTEYTAEKEKVNIFALCSALSERDRKHLWLLATEFLHAGTPAEEIIGVLLWQLKMFRLVAKTETPEEVALKPFQYTNAKRALARFKEGEVDELARALLAVYHDGHMGKRDTVLALEEWILRV